MAEQPTFASDWFRQRLTGADAVAAIEAEELRALTDIEALRLADALLSAAPVDHMSRDRRESSGFVEQQRLFALRR